MREDVAMKDPGADLRRLDDDVVAVVGRHVDSVAHLRWVDRPAILREDAHRHAVKVHRVVHGGSSG